MKYRIQYTPGRRRIKRVFIRDKNGECDELTYEEFQFRKSTDSTYANKRFICLYGMLLEVTEKEYHDFYRSRNHCRYIQRRDKKHRLRSVEAIGEENIADKESRDVADTVCERDEIRRLRISLAKLEESERELIDALYYRGMTVRKLAKKTGTPKSTVHYHEQKVLEKLRKIF